MISTHTGAIIRRLSLVLVVFAITAGGCAGKKTTEEEAAPTAGMDSNAMGDSDHGTAMGMQTVFFPYDSFTIDSEAKNVLKANADILKGDAGVKIQIEGHCDQRGGIQYNIALGEKRANAVRKYLIDMGIKGGRITTISYGKERPLDSNESEDSYAKNRRANFVVTAR
jgi:peptidoglycan-associated lipoprotein